MCNPKPMAGCMIPAAVTPCSEQPAPPRSEVTLFPLQAIVSFKAQENESTYPLIISNPKVTSRETNDDSGAPTLRCRICPDFHWSVMKFSPTGPTAPDYHTAAYWYTYIDIYISPSNCKVVCRRFAPSLPHTRAAHPFSSSHTCKCTPHSC